MSQMWPCSAYGADLDETGTMCFVAGLGERRCAHLDECREVISEEQRRVYRRINELAAHGDDVWAELSLDITDPTQLLNGEEHDDEPET
ncbi:hypothetical protein ACFVVM_32755 [Nocardia sp. NPDC058176]|uniref:hypothetical protein n=1 Tax=Nocardia sp. NPDC058176 TaxID=3346368 RepID=UPI0036DF77E4